MLGKAVVLRNSLSRRFAALGSSFFFSSEKVQNNSDVITEEGNNRTLRFFWGWVNLSRELTW